jgi:hypothetical protein|eukprot:SAG25_NODE_601_length_6632_cov_6.861319_5_plen_54_part_00
MGVVFCGVAVSVRAWCTQVRVLALLNQPLHAEHQAVSAQLTAPPPLAGFEEAD